MKTKFDRIFLTELEVTIGRSAGYAVRSGAVEETEIADSGEERRVLLRPKTSTATAEIWDHRRSRGRNGLVVLYKDRGPKK